MPSCCAISERVSPYIYQISEYILKTLKSIVYIGNILLNKCLVVLLKNLRKVSGKSEIYLDKVSGISDNYNM
jgi:hypothetical protein